MYIHKNATYITTAYKLLKFIQPVLKIYKERDREGKRTVLFLNGIF